MRSERWKQLDQLFHSALEREPSARAAFLDEACGGDDSLHAKVESLLAAHEEAGSFIEQPALDVEAQSVAADQGQLSVGRTIGHYRIVSQLGAGGMGEVYLAEDTALGRKVALKLLPIDFTRDIVRVRRFQQEAHAASALNHPNIITIHEIAQVDERHLIATEFIDGETLRERIRGSRSQTSEDGSEKVGTALPIREVLNIGIQIADALAAAHEAGIVHRDIKPENIMVRRRDGYIKVLDFGLAKLTPLGLGGYEVDREAATRPQVKTSAGLVMGTVSYMSPEQTRGEQVDARTDIWSLGVVLYELVAGRAPFDRPTPSEIIAAILDREPPPLTNYVREIPSELERIVSKALTKRREERYQTVNDLLIDLRRFQQQLQTEAVIGLYTRRAPSLNPVQSAKGGEGLVSEMNQDDSGVTSIAVLPFVNMSTDPENEFFCDGLAEELLNALTKIGGIKVAARSSAFSFKNKDSSVSEIGVALGVNKVLEGSLRKSGDQLRISVQLINASDGYHLWSERYDRSLRDIFDLQDEITIAVVDALKVKLLGDEKAALLKRHTDNPQAYELYLKGRHFWNRRTVEGFTKAIEQFQQAIDKDPHYALAYAGLADCYSVMQVYASAPQSEMLPKAKAAAIRALQLDDSLAEAHASLGWIHLLSWRWRDAEEEFKHAIQLNPKYPIAHVWYSAWLNIMGRLDEAMREVERAEELDPLLPALAGNLPRIQILKGDLEAAVAFCNNAVELDPTYHYVHVILAVAYQKQGRYEEAIAEAQTGVELSRRSSGYLAPLGYCQAVAGRRSEALEILKELEKKHTRGESPGACLAWVHAGLGDKDQAFAWLEKDLQDRSGPLAFLMTGWPMLDMLRSDVRWNALLRRMGLPIEVSDRKYERMPEVTREPPCDLPTNDGVTLPEAPTTSTAGYLVNQVKYHKIATVVSLLVVALAVTAAWLWYFKSMRAGPLLTDKDTILLADFENKTGDEVFDGALKQGLAIQLGQSPFLSIFPDSDVRKTLKLMNRSPDEHVTGEIAREICERQGLKAFIAGSIAPLGSQYVLTLEAVNGHSGDVLAREQTEAKDKEQVLKALSQTATSLRERLGESLSSIEKFANPLEVTTSSLEALKAFSLGNELRNKGAHFEAVPFFKRATELDPNFASAYVLLAMTYDNTGRFGMKAELAAKAYALRDRVTERERLRITDRYYAYVTHELDRHLETLQIYKRTYPRDPLGPFWLSDVYFNLGQFEMAVEEATEGIRRSPSFDLAYINLAQGLIPLNRFDEAREVSEGLLQRRVDDSDIHSYLYKIAFVYSDSGGMRKQLDWARGRSDEYVALDWQADTAAFTGQWQRAQDFSRGAVNVATHSDARDAAGRFAAKVAAYGAVFGQCAQAKESAAQAVALNQSDGPLVNALIGLALCGESTRAERSADEYDKRYPKNTFFNGPWLPPIRAAVELQRGDAARAIELLEPVVRYEGAGQFWPQYLRGQAYLKFNRGSEAALEFQKILDHRGQAPLSALYPLAHLGLARAASLMHDTEKSRKAYDQFFALWKDADTDIPILKRAKQEYAMLK